LPGQLAVGHRAEPRVTLRHPRRPELYPFLLPISGPVVPVAMTDRITPDDELDEELTKSSRLIGMSERCDPSDLNAKKRCGFLSRPVSFFARHAEPFSRVPPIPRILMPDRLRERRDCSSTEVGQ
jgi:hypothetical protein